MIDKKYIILNAEKQPIHKFKDGNGLKSWDEVKDFDNVGLYVTEPFIVLDFDTVEDSNIIQDILSNVDIKCRIMKTTRGVHCWFKSPNAWKNFTKQRLACGIYADCRSWGRNGYVKIKDGGKMREWLRQCSDEEMSDVPAWLYPISAGEMFNFKNLANGESRNQKLFNYILFLQHQRFTKEQVRETIQIINSFVFKDSLPAAELSTILRDESFKSEEEIEKEIKLNSNGEKFRHDVFAEDILTDSKVITVNDSIYIYDNDYYRRNKNQLNVKMVEARSNITRAQRTEVLEYIKIKTNVEYETIKRNPYIVNLINTRLDLRGNDDGTAKLMPFDDTAIEFERVPVVYNSDAYSEDLHKMLMKVFCNDIEVFNLFCEIVADCLLRKNIFQRAFLFFGGGKNGKSTILRLIRRFIGEDNCSTIELDRLTDTFMTAELENKLVNLGDDVNYKAMTNTGTLKKLFSGEPLQVQRKGQTPFTMTPYATEIFSCNEIPRTADRSDGMYRRWLFVPFNAIFNPTDKDYDPMIEEKITTPESLSYLLNLAIKGAARLIKNGRFTEPKIVTDTLNTYKRENSLVLQWIDDNGIDARYLLETQVQDIYKAFLVWCDVAKIKNPTGRNHFYNEIKKEFNFENTLKFSREDRKRYFVESTKI